jgi:YaiO family outer membrane protein
MKTHRSYILGACLLLLLPSLLTAQSASVPPAEAQPAATPEPGTKATAAAKQIEPEVIFEFGSSYERLSNEAGDWKSYFLRFNRKFASGQTLYGEASVVRRFDLTDPGFMIGWYQPLNETRRWSATFEAAGSPTHDVLPAFSFYGQIERNFGKGWLGHAGVRHSHYSSDNVNMGVFGVENYFKAYRAAYTLYVAHLNGGGTSASHAFQANYYYDERNSIGVGVAFGQEIESLGNGLLLRTPVQEVNVNGKQWMNHRWGFSYVLLWHRQGTLYTRSGGQLGVLLRF